MKKLIRILAAMVIAGLLLAGCAVAFSHFVYGRSLKASAYEIVQRYRRANPLSVEEETARLEKKREAGEKPFQMPGYLLRRGMEITESERDGLQLFTFNPGHGDVTALYLHGGAYVGNFNDYQLRFIERLAKEADCEIIAPAYHVAPFGDCERAMRELTALMGHIAGELDGRFFVLMGDSAGGGLALALAETLAQAGERLPERLILVSPWTEVSMDNPEVEKYVAKDPILNLPLMKLHGQYWANGRDTHDWQVSPLYGEMSGLPPVTIYCGTRELLYPDLVLTCEKLREAGVDAELRVGRGLNHDYPLMPIPEAETAIREIVSLMLGDARIRWD